MPEWEVPALRTGYLPGGLEVEYDLASSDWAGLPLDEGTRGEIQDGRQILWDKVRWLGRAIQEAASRPGTSSEPPHGLREMGGTPGKILAAVEDG